VTDCHVTKGSTGNLTVTGISRNLAPIPCSANLSHFRTPFFHSHRILVLSAGWQKQVMWMTSI